jgi:tetraacyldisaccharide 4'-kinase
MGIIKLMSAHDIWYGRGLGPSLARIALLPLSLLYWLGWQTYLGIYRLGLKRASAPHRPIIIVGNFTVGGSGKSPLTMHLAHVLLKLGHRVVIGCSGYGSPKAEAAQLAPEGPLDPAEWGDEPAMIRAQLPEVPLIVGRRRVLAAQICAQRYPDAVLLMDDGLQHLPLQADVRIAIDDEETRNRWVLPAGPYREPRSNKRADLILPGDFTIVQQALQFEQLHGEPKSLAARINALCAIGRPDRFRDDLAASGLQIAAFEALPDHDPLAAGTLFDRFEPELPLVATAKDWVKLQRRPDLGNREIWIARQSVRVEPAEAFERWLHEKTLEAMAQKGGH